MFLCQLALCTVDMQIQSLVVEQEKMLKWQWDEVLELLTSTAMKCLKMVCWDHKGGAYRIVPFLLCLRFAGEVGGHGDCDAWYSP